MANKADYDFCKMMISHHQKAVEAAKKVLRDGEDPDLQDLADDVMKERASDVKFMQQWMSDHGDGDPDDD